MNRSSLAEQLRDLHVDLKDSVDRFEQVKKRVRRNRRRHAASAAALAVAVGAAAVTVGPGIVPNAQDPVARDASRGSASAGAVTVHPGGVRIVTLGEPVTTVVATDQTLELGDRPAAATAVQVSARCIAPGTLTGTIPSADTLAKTDPDGFSYRCSTPQESDSDEQIASNTYTLPAGQHTLGFAVTDGSQWEITTTYVQTAVTAWATNARGQTYGEPNDLGTPDLQPADATNGSSGYISTSQVDATLKALRDGPASHHRLSVPVYLLDGLTVIGKFFVGGGNTANGGSSGAASR